MQKYPLVKLALGALALGCTAAPALGQTDPYYITAGDQQRVTVVQNGAVINTFTATGGGPTAKYPISVRNTIWLDGRGNTGAVEYTLAGVPTGNVSIGGANLDQLLDGTTDGVAFNYGVQCCTANSVNDVTRANLDWSGQSTLFQIPNNEQGEGIAYDTANGHLFVSTFSGHLFELTTTGALLNTFSVSGILSSLAYQQSTNTLWTAGSGNQIRQLSTTGTQLNLITVPGAVFGNNFGGEFGISAVATATPEFGSFFSLGGFILAGGAGLY